MSSGSIAHLPRQNGFRGACCLYREPLFVCGTMRSMLATGQGSFRCHPLVVSSHLCLPASSMSTAQKLRDARAVNTTQLK